VLFSIVIPAFNRASTIESCINSVLSQTNQNFEIIVVDDGSKDNTKEVVERIGDSRIKYIYQDNGGGSKARNTGIDHSAGKYIAFLDSDDIFLPHHLENALTELEKCEKTCIYTQVIVERGDGIQFLKPHRGIKDDEHISDYLMRDRGFVQTSTLVVPKELALKSKYDEKINAGQDYDIAIKLAFNGGKLKMLPDPGAIWNDTWSENRLSSKSNPQQRLDWLNRIKPMLTEKAYWAELGWPVARAFSQNGYYFKAMGLYFRALCRGCYRPKMGIVIFLQVLLSKGAYRKMSDFLAKFGIKP
jgi:glycosyltransferase involved in cell wall biosynthesis